MRADFTARIVSFDEVYSTCYELATEITKRKDVFDLIVAIARGACSPVD